MNGNKIKELMGSGMSEMEAVIQEIFKLDVSKTPCCVYSEMEVFPSLIKKGPRPIPIRSQVEDDEVKKYLEAICEHRCETRRGDTDTAVMIRNHLGTCQICDAVVPIEFFCPNELMEILSKFMNVVSQAKNMASYTNAPDEVRKYFMVLSYLVPKFFSMYESVIPEDDKAGVKKMYANWDGDVSSILKKKLAEDKIGEDKNEEEKMK